MHLKTVYMSSVVWLCLTTDTNIDISVDFMTGDDKFRTPPWLLFGIFLLHARPLRKDKLLLLKFGLDHVKWCSAREQFCLRFTEVSLIVKLNGRKVRGDPDLFATSHPFLPKPRNSGVVSPQLSRHLLLPVNAVNQCPEKLEQSLNSLKTWRQWCQNDVPTILELIFQCLNSWSAYIITADPEHQRIKLSRKVICQRVRLTAWCINAHTLFRTRQK